MLREKESFETGEYFPEVRVGMFDYFKVKDLKRTLEQIKNENADFASHRNEKIAQAMANKTASKYTQKKRSNEEMNAMIGQLFASSNPNFSPNGEEISKLLTEDYFINLFS
jgi:DNA mismatch repair protein MutL